MVEYLARHIRTPTNLLRLNYHLLCRLQSPTCRYNAATIATMISIDNAVDCKRKVTYIESMTLTYRHQIHLFQPPEITFIYQLYYLLIALPDRWSYGAINYHLCYLFNLRPITNTIVISSQMLAA